METLQTKSEHSRVAMEVMRRENAENQSKILSLLSRSEGPKNTEEEEKGENSGAVKMLVSKVQNSALHKLKDEALNEFRQSVKKIELSAFNGEDPAGWISYAEIYFRIQETSDAVRVNLAQLCMEGSTIHFFNALINEKEEVKWDDLKKAAPYNLSK